MSLDFTPEQFEAMTNALSERITSGDKLLEQEYADLAHDRTFNLRFIEAAVSAGLDVTSHAVQQHVRALVITFFIYGKELGKNALPTSPSKFVN